LARLVRAEFFGASAANQRCIDARAFICHSQRTLAGIELPKMPRRSFRVGRSRTGLGLFATRPIRKRARIAEYKGRLLTTKAAEKVEVRGNRYLYEINSRWTIDGTPRSNLARYGNHSCNPNAETTIVKRRVFIYALRAIKPGEEITYDYGVDYLKNVIGRSNCKCGRCMRRRAKRARERRALQKRRAARLAGKRRRARRASKSKAKR
jgi:hypothetical protein